MKEKEPKHTLKRKLSEYEHAIGFLFVSFGSYGLHEYEGVSFKRILSSIVASSGAWLIFHKVRNLNEEITSLKGSNDYLGRHIDYLDEHIQHLEKKFGSEE